MSFSIVSAVVMSCACILSSNAADIMLRIQNKEGKYGFCNTNGNLVIDCMYDSASSFFPNGVCAVKKGKHLYFINKSGNEILKQWGGHTISDVRICLPFTANGYALMFFHAGEGKESASENVSPTFTFKSNKGVYKCINCRGDEMFCLKFAENEDPLFYGFWGDYLVLRKDARPYEACKKLKRMEFYDMKGNLVATEDCIAFQLYPDGFALTMLKNGRVYAAKNLRDFPGRELDAKAFFKMPLYDAMSGTLSVIQSTTNSISFMKTRIYDLDGNENQILKNKISMYDVSGWCEAGMIEVGVAMNGGEKTKGSQIVKRMKYGMIDLEGKQIVPCVYDGCDMLGTNYILIVMTDDERQMRIDQYRDRTGKFLWQLEFSSLDFDLQVFYESWINYRIGGLDFWANCADGSVIYYDEKTKQTVKIPPGSKSRTEFPWKMTFPTKNASLSLNPAERPVL